MLLLHRQCHPKTDPSIFFHQPEPSLPIPDRIKEEIVIQKFTFHVNFGVHNVLLLSPLSGFGSFTSGVLRFANGVVVYRSLTSECHFKGQDSVLEQCLFVLYLAWFFVKHLSDIVFIGIKAEGGLYDMRCRANEELAGKLVELSVVES